MLYPVAFLTTSHHHRGALVERAAAVVGAKLRTVRRRRSRPTLVSRDLMNAPARRP